MRKSLRTIGFSIPLDGEHVSIAERRYGFKFPKAYIDIVREHSQLELAQSELGEGYLFIHSIYALGEDYKGFVDLARQMGGVPPLTTGLFPFASDRSGALFWDLKSRLGDDYKVVSNPLILPDAYETEQSWPSTAALLDDYISNIPADPVIGRRYHDATPRSSIERMVDGFLRDRKNYRP